MLTPNRSPANSSGYVLPGEGDPSDVLVMASVTGRLPGHTSGRLCVGAAVR